MVIEPAALGDLPAVERLLIATFHGHLCPSAVERQARVRLALRPAPPAGLIVARMEAALTGVVTVVTAETAGLPSPAWLPALRPLGLLGAARFLATALRTSLYRPRPDEAYLFGLAVAPAYRRRGIAARLLDAAEQHARALGKRRMIAHVARDNAASLALFRRRGYDVAAPSGRALARLRPVSPAFLSLEKAL